MPMRKLIRLWLMHGNVRTLHLDSALSGSIEFAEHVTVDDG